MSYQREKVIFERDGVAIVRQLLDPPEFGTLSAELARYIVRIVPTLADSHAFYQDRSRPETLKQLQHMDCDPFFRDYAAHPKWRGLAEALLGEPARCRAPEWFNKPPGTEHPTPPHQDNYYFKLHPPNVLTIWMALDQVDEENGCLRYVAGSHRRGSRPHARSEILGFSQAITDYGPQDHAQEIRVELEPGDVVCHHGMTIHRAEPNRSPTRHRRAFALVFEGVSCRRDEEAFARYRSDLETQHRDQGLQRLQP